MGSWPIGSDPALGRGPERVQGLGPKLPLVSIKSASPEEEAPEFLRDVGAVSEAGNGTTFIQELLCERA